MYEELSRSLRHVEVVLEEALDRHERLVIEAFERTVFEYFLEEHLAERGGKLIDKTSYAEVLVADDRLFGVEYLADLDRGLSLLVGARKILDVVDGGSDADRNLRIEFGAESVGDRTCKLLDLADVGAALDLLDDNDVLLTYADDIILVLVGEEPC